MTATTRQKYPTATTALCMALERTINKALDHDPATKQRLAAQAGRSVSLELDEPSLSLSLIFMAKGVQVSPFTQPDADCSLSGKASGLLRLMSGPKKSLAGSDLTLAGQTGFLMELVDIAKHLDIDWQEIICQYFGDVAGHGIAKLLRFNIHQARRIGKRSLPFFHDFLTEELQAVPSAPELNAFNEGVDELRDDVERLHARLVLIKKTLAP
jgi:ubiquinone biosynthesis protein UbiJ